MYFYKNILELMLVLRVFIVLAGLDTFISLFRKDILHQGTDGAPCSNLSFFS